MFNTLSVLLSLFHIPREASDVRRTIENSAENAFAGREKKLKD
jgi:hypothetical protein